MGVATSTATVYLRRGVQGGSNDLGSIEITGTGTIDVYMSNAATVPASKATMSKTNSALAVGFTNITLMSTYILFDVASGSPVVNTCNLV